MHCDEVRSHHRFLHQLSKVTGAGIEDPPDLTALRPFLSSVNILLVLDNAETILDPDTPEALALYSAIEELSTIKTISLVITTRISTIPTTCQQVLVPALSIIPAREVFYSIYTNQGRVADIDSILQELDYHPLSVTLLATVAIQNRWDHSRLIREWEQRRISILQTRHGRGLTAAIELSLKSPTFTRLGPDAKDILGVIAALPQGVDERQLEWVFPTVSNARHIIDTFIILSLTHHNRNFVTMFGPLQEYLGPDGHSSSLFSSVRNQYITRIRDIVHNVGPGHVTSQEIQWLMSEKANIDFLLTLSLRMNPDSTDIVHICHVIANIFHSHPSRIAFNG